MSGGTAPGRPLRTVVAGTNFGRFYVDAVNAHPAFALAGILSRGGAHSRELAGRLSVPCYARVTDLPEDIDAACVVVPSAVMGGHGTELGRELLERGVHVLQEHPLHPDELAGSLRLARARGRQFRVNTHYPQVRSVRRFLRAATALRARQRVLFVDAAAPVHVLAPLVDILGRALGGLRPWRLDDPAPVSREVRAATGERTPVQVLHGAIAGAPVTLRVQNQLHPGDRDNHSLFWHRIAIGTEGGVLTLADTHGPVLWHPRLHSPRDEGHRLVFEAGPGAENLLLASSETLGDRGERSPRFDEIFSAWWPAAVAEALGSFAEGIAAGTDPLRSAGHDLAVFALWRDLMARLGPPELIRPPAPQPLTAQELDPGPGHDAEPGHDAQPAPGGGERPAVRPHVRPTAARRDPAAARAEDEPGAGYTGPAEFFDLGAGEHTGRTGPAVVACLAGMDPRGGPLIDIGAGTGLVTRQIALAYPDCHLVAAEPAAGMRAVLTARLAEDPDIARRVTVRSDAANELALPDRICAAVLCGVLGHLDAPRRRELLRDLARRLAPGAPLVVEMMGLTSPVSMPATRLRRAALGRQTYEWWMAGEPSGEERMRLDTTWRVFEDGELVREVRDQYHWYTVGLDRIARESGLELERPPAPHGAAVPHLGVLRGAERRPLTR